jgi:hypothetical protein
MAERLEIAGHAAHATTDIAGPRPTRAAL